MYMSDKKQTKINFYTNILALLANVIVGIYYTPYLVNSLGLAAYGVLPLALIINQYISVATQTLTHAYTRFYSIALQKGNYEEASKVISTSFVAVLLISLLLIPIGVGIISNVNSIFQIPLGLLSSSRLLFGYTILSFIVSLVSSLLNVTLYAINRLDLMNIMKIFRAVFKLLFVIILFETVYVDVSFVGLTNLMTEILILIVSLYLFFKFKPSEVRLSYTLFDKVTLYSIIGMSVWVLIQLCGDTLLYRTDNLIVNHYWGTEASGALGAISEIGNYVSVIVNVIGSLFGPLILTAYAKGNHEEVKSLFTEQSTIVGCLAAILAGTISGCANAILEIWLSNGMGQYHWWLVVKMIVLPYYAAGGILAFVYRSWNRMRLPALGTILIGIIDISMLVAVCEWQRPIDAMPVLVLSAVFSILQCFVLNVVAVYKIYKDCKSCFVPIFIKITISFLLCFGCGITVTSLVHVHNLFELAIMLIMIGTIMLLLVLFVVLSKEEKNKLSEIIIK